MKLDGSFLAAALAVVACGDAGAPAPRAATVAVTPSVQSPVAPTAAASVLRAEVAAFVRERAHPLGGIDPGGARDDLAWLVGAVKAARVVGLGEQTHGTHEHARLKHRLIEALVRDAGVSAVAFEAPMLEVADLDAWVKGGEGDAERDAVSLGFWCWRIEEVLDLLRWMRAYNAEPTTKRKISLYGFDMQKTPRAATTLVAYLDRVDAKRAKRARTVLATLADPFEMADYGTRWIKDKDAIREVVMDAGQLLEQKRDELVAKTGEPDWARAQLAATILAQYQAMELGENAGGVREAAMAANLGWLLEREGADGKIVVWAHNGHVDADQGQGMLGSLLRASLKDAYVAAGLAFGSGSFRAFALPRTIGAMTQVFELGPGPAGSVEDALGAARLERFGIVLRDAPSDGALGAWLAAEHPMRSIGWAYEPEHPERYVEASRVRKAYDVLFYVGAGTPTRPLAQTEDDPFPTRDAPRDLDLEEADPKASWSAFGGAHGYAMTKEGGAIAVARAAWPSRPEAFGGARQRVRADPWRGSTVRARLRVKMEGKGAGRVWLRASRDAGMRGKEIAFAETAVSGARFTTYDVRLTVPKEADTLDFGVALVGDGRIWLDDVKLETVR